MFIALSNMKKLFAALFSLLALAAAVPATAQLKREALLERLDSCEAILQEFQGNPKLAIPADVLRSAKGLIIVNQFSGSFFLGVKDGYAVMLVRRPNGKWSLPVFLRAGELSFGLQFGGRATNTIMVLQDEAVARRLFKGRFNLGAEFKAVAGIRATGVRSIEAQRLTNSLPDGASVLIYSTHEGLQAGLALKTGWISPDTRANQMFYNTRYGLPEILYSDWITAPDEVKFLMSEVTRQTR
jgi:lipid-binding SYLF domain-containing protein